MEGGYGRVGEAALCCLRCWRSSVGGSCRAFPNVTALGGPSFVSHKDGAPFAVCYSTTSTTSTDFTISAVISSHTLPSDLHNNSNHLPMP